jgi:hypothetical protein
MKRQGPDPEEAQGFAQAEAEAQRTVWGDPLWAVLIPPRLTSFRKLAQIGDEHLDVDFTGWNKFVLLAADRAYRLPREANGVEWFERELAAYRTPEPTGLPVVPKLLGEWRNEASMWIRSPPFPDSRVLTQPMQLI